MQFNKKHLTVLFEYAILYKRKFVFNFI